MARINLLDILVHREDFADFMCGFCQMALERPRAAPCCGNCLCEECWVLFRRRGDKRCIACRAALMNIRANRLRPSPYADRMIAQQKVRCENDECAWSGRWDTYKDHKTNGCPLQPSEVHDASESGQCAAHSRELPTKAAPREQAAEGKSKT